MSPLFFSDFICTFQIKSASLQCYSHKINRVQAEKSLHFTVQAFFMPVLEQTYSVSVYPRVER